MPSTNWHFELGQTKLDHSFFPVNISIGECCQQQEEQFWTFPRLKNHSNVKIKTMENEEEKFRRLLKTRPKAHLSVSPFHLLASRTLPYYICLFKSHLYVILW